MHALSLIQLFNLIVFISQAINNIYSGALLLPNAWSFNVCVYLRPHPPWTLCVKYYHGREGGRPDWIWLMVQDTHRHTCAPTTERIINNIWTQKRASTMVELIASKASENSSGTGPNQLYWANLIAGQRSRINRCAIWTFCIYKIREREYWVIGTDDGAFNKYVGPSSLMTEHRFIGNRCNNYCICFAVVRLVNNSNYSSS